MSLGLCHFAVIGGVFPIKELTYCGIPVVGFIITGIIVIVLLYFYMKITKKEHWCAACARDLENRLKKKWLNTITLYK